MPSLSSHHRNLELPACLVKKTAELLVKYSGETDVKWALEIFQDARIHSILDRAKKYYPESPWKGQWGLLHYIITNRPREVFLLKPEAEAELWRKNCLKKIEELQSEIGEMPRNFRGNFEYMLHQDYYKNFGQEILGKLMKYDFLSSIHSALENCELYMHGFGRQTTGDRALRPKFVKELSLHIMAMTGEEKNEEENEKEKREERIDTVLNITEIVFKCELERNQITRDIRRERDEFDLIFAKGHLNSLWEIYS